MNIKKICAHSIIALGLFLSFTSVHAAGCGLGAITEVKEGGWNSESLYIKIDFRGDSGSHPGTYSAGYIRFRAVDMSAERLRAIRSIAYLALITGPRLVWVGTHHDSCSRATEISFYDDIN